MDNEAKQDEGRRRRELYAACEKIFANGWPTKPEDAKAAARMLVERRIDWDDIENMPEPMRSTVQDFLCRVFSHFNLEAAE